MALQPHEIATLFAFTEKKMVRWYDLQVELVDHLASKIEAEMEADKTLSFERALGNVYASFGIFGFAHIVQQKEANLRKKNNQLLWQAVKKQFTWPNVIRSLGLLCLIATLTFNVTLENLLIIYIVCYLVDVFLFRRWNFINPTKKTGKKLLMLATFPGFSIGTFIYLEFMMFCFSDVFTGEYVDSTAFRIYFMTLLYLGTIYYLAAKNVTNSIIEQAKNDYAEAFV
ncbi:hypothetical protein ACFOWM_01230 [Ferruginibacter yonginensis]|uniref:Uncharacterized protein n=1 Tax=Ferruginibacter yonginensis TaxID=1310416 RepID=A0ABV8QMF7_9BACT